MGGVYSLGLRVGHQVGGAGGRGFGVDVGVGVEQQRHERFVSSDARQHQGG